jgi:hypothetical protein
MTKRFLYGLGVLAAIAGLAACDAGYGGDLLGNQPPETFLAVRDTSLVERICTPTPTGPVCSDDDHLFTSTVFVSWGGTDPDGFVVRFELRYYDTAERPGPEDLWTSTTRRDTLILLPIPAGRTTAAVAFEIRAVDNEGAKDPSPARTVFPIVNSPPRLALTRRELPPDTSWTVFSFAWDATDPDGPDDLAAIEVSLNDPDSFVRLPATARFVSFRAEGATPGAATADARVFLGRAFTPTDLVVPGLRLDADNTLYIRAVDRTETASPAIAYPDRGAEEVWFVRQPRSEVLLINDYRSSRSNEVMPFHASVLGGYLGGAAFDTWDLSRPDIPPASNNEYSDAFPASAAPTLAETLKLWRYIYWVSDSVTDGVRGNNLALAAANMEGFLEQGGRIFVQVPFTAPPAGDLDPDNPAYDLLPSESVVLGPGNVPPNLAIPNQGLVTAVEAVPGTGRRLPTLRSERIALTLPYTLNFATSTPLYQGAFVNRSQQNAPWTGPSFLASMDVERRVGLLALQLYTQNRFNFVGEGGDANAPRLAIQYILEGLGFPGQPQD